MQNDLHGQHVVVTGGNGALGSAVVRRMIEDGATVHVPSYGDSVDAKHDWAKHERVHITTSLDLTDESAAVPFYEALPPIWASVHCAGGFSMAEIADTSRADLERMWNINAVSCFLCCREAVRSMRRGSGGGRIVNVAARPALEPVGGMVAYSMSKAAVVSLTESLAREVAAEGILVNAVVPAMLDTPANRAAMPDAEHERWPSPAEVAEIIAFAVGSANGVASGALVPVYGKLM